VLLDIDYPRNLWQASCLYTLYDAGCTLIKGNYQGIGAVGAGATNTVLPYASGGSGGSINVSMGGSGGAPISRVILTSSAAVNATYISSPSVTLSDPTGSGAVIRALVSPHAVFGGTFALYGFIVVSAGHGYTNPAITISGGGGSGATAEAVLAPGVETVNGLSVGKGGGGYSQAAQLQISGGGGTGATGTLIISKGVITGVIKTNSGTGYSSAPTATVVDESGQTFNQGTLMFQGGQNAGVLVQIKSATNTALTLANPLLFVPVAGDVFTILPGCDHTTGQGGCGKFNNLLNFRGFPFVPPPETAY
jgi:hypothetical protein